jgi:acyl-CoA thioester hydrolase
MKLPVTKTDIQTRFFDTDALGHISSGSYFQYLELARTDFFIDISKNGDVPITAVVNVNIDYVSEALFGEKISVVTWCSKLGNKSMVISSEIYSGDRISAKGTVTAVGFDTDSRTSRILPENWEISEYSGG